MKIILEDMMYIHQPTAEILARIEEDLTFDNKAYHNAIRYSKYNSTKIPKYIYYYMRINEGVAVPRGYNIDLDKYVVEDNRIENTVKYPKCKIKLREDQDKAFTKYLDDPNKGLILLQTGKGKSILGLYIAYALRQKTLVIVHKDDLVSGWKNDAKVVFGDDLKTGLIKAKKKDIGEQITIATIQTLNKQTPEYLDTLYNEFGCVIVDETHHVGSKNYDLVNNFKGAYRIGLTATLERGDKLEPIVHNIFGGIAYKQPVNKDDKDILPVTVNMIESKISYTPKVQFKGRDKKGNPRYAYIKKEDEHKYQNLIDITDIKQKEKPHVSYHDIDNLIVEDAKFSKQVVKDIVNQVKLGKSCIAFFSKKKHIDLYYNLLSRYLDDSKILKYYGDAKQSKEEMKQIAESRKALITLATYSIATEGTNCRAWQYAFLVSSINNGKNVEQAVGRIRRTNGEKDRAYVYDYYHPKVYTVGRHHFTRIARYNNLKFDIRYNSSYNKPTRLITRGF